MATKATIKKISDDFGSITGTLSKGSISDDRTPALSGKLNKKLGKKESLLIFSDGVEIGEANVKGKKWNFEPISDLEDTSCNFQAIVSKGGKLGNASKPYQILFDTESPKLDVTDNVNGIAEGDIKFDFQFSEDVTGFTNKSFKISGGALDSLSGSGDSYTVIVSPKEDSSGTLTFKIRNKFIADVAGNKLSKNIVLKKDFDTKVKDKISPTLTITGQTDEIINKDIIFEFSFT